MKSDNLQLPDKVRVRCLSELLIGMVSMMIMMIMMM